MLSPLKSYVPQRRLLGVTRARAWQRYEGRTAQNGTPLEEG